MFGAQEVHGHNPLKDKELPKTLQYVHRAYEHMKANHTFAIKTTLATSKSEDFLGSGKFLITTPLYNILGSMTIVYLGLCLG